MLDYNSEIFLEIHEQKKKLLWNCPETIGEQNTRWGQQFNQDLKAMEDRWDINMIADNC